MVLGFMEMNMIMKFVLLHVNFFISAGRKPSRNQEHVDLYL